jgi:hypothetical protein
MKPVHDSFIRDLVRRSPIRPIFWAICVLLNLTRTAMSGERIFYLPDSNGVVHAYTLEELVREGQKQAEQAKSQSPAPHLSKEDLEWANQVARSFKEKPWPEGPEKEEVLKHAGATLRSAMDMKEIESACLNTNQEGAATLRSLAVVAVSNLADCAVALANPKLRTDRDLAELRGESAYFLFTFGVWTTNGFPSVIQQVDKRLPDATKLIMGARFYQNGKLQDIRLISWDGKGDMSRKGEVSFAEDGKVRHYWIKDKGVSP